jgi:tellurite resistance protein TerC
VLRGIMIAMGTALVHKFDWMFYVFGAILLLSALRMLKDEPGEGDVSNNASVRLVRRFLPVTPELHGSRFFVRQDGKLIATPLFVALNIVNVTDVVFAVDSIPAIIAVTRDPFLVFTSNAFAILGLRSLYFAVVGLMQMFRYIKYSLVFILAFVGFKMIFMNHFHVSNLLSLGIIIVALLVGVIVSLTRPAAVAVHDGSSEPR